MRVQVETYVDERGAEKLRRIRLDDRVVEVADNIDQWHGPGYRYVKVKSGNSDLYILRHDETAANWELTMYQRVETQWPRASTKAAACSPRIAAVTWGRPDIEDVGTFRDAKVFPGGARSGIGTRPVLLTSPASSLPALLSCLTMGPPQSCCPRAWRTAFTYAGETLRLLADKRVRTHVLPTAEAVKLYNELRDEERVAGLFHTTC